MKDFWLLGTQKTRFAIATVTITTDIVYVLNFLERTDLAAEARPVVVIPGTVVDEEAEAEDEAVSAVHGGRVIEFSCLVSEI